MLFFSPKQFSSLPLCTMEAQQDHATGETCRDMVKVDISTFTKKMWISSLEEEPARPKSSKMHKVPDLLACGKTPQTYQPRIVSLGPYHWGNPELRLFQERKRPMADRLIPDKKFQSVLREEISISIDKLIAAYPSEVKKRMVTDEWEEMLFLDGCFVLYFIFCFTENKVEGLEMKKYEIELVHNDLFLLENQLPYQLLKILSGNDPELLDLIFDYILVHKINNYQSWGIFDDEAKPVHLLDYLHSVITVGRTEPETCGSGWLPTHTHHTGIKGSVLPHAKELVTKGIHLKPNSSGFIKDVFFKHHFVYGTLRLPKMIVDVSTRSLFLNLAAYEMCADVGSMVTSYICFLDSLVNHAEDIKELKSAGVLVNYLPTDEDAAELFNEMSEGIHPDTDTYADVKRRIQKFSQHKAQASLASWIAEVYHSHFRSPLTAMAVLAASLALCLAATQTYFTVFPRGN